MQKQYKFAFTILAICFGVASISAGLILSGSLSSLEAKSVDARYRLRYAFNRNFNRIKVSKELVLVGVDQKSVDPQISKNADRWGAGGWLTRDLWIDSLPYLASCYKPSVVAYDIIFLPYRPEEKTIAADVDTAVTPLDRYLKNKTASFGDLILEEAFPRRDLLTALDRACSANFGSKLFDINDARMSDASIPLFVTACELISTNVLFGARAWEVGENVDKVKQKADTDKLTYLQSNALPPDCVTNPHVYTTLFHNASLPFDDLAAAVKLGCINVPRDEDGIIRRIPLLYGFKDPTANEQLVFVPSLALRACMMHLGIHLQEGAKNTPAAGLEVTFGKEIHLWTRNRDIRIPIDIDGRLFLDFGAKIGDFDQSSYVALLDFGEKLKQEKLGEKFATEKAQLSLKVAHGIRDILQGRIMLVGQTFTGAGDVGPCAIDTYAPLVFIHMTAVDNILRASFMRPLSDVYGSVLVFLLLGLIALENILSKHSVAGIGTPVMIGGWLFLCMAFYFLGYCLPVVAPTMAMIVSAGLVSFYRYQVEQKGRLAIRKEFSTMVSGRVLQYMEEHPESFARSEKREATMFFSDVAGFTSISEKLAPEKLSQILNDYLTPMTDLILERDGYVNKYAGDGIMAVWGVPYPSPDHAVQACFSALEQQAKIRELLAFFKTEYNVELHVRMGLNSGFVSAGNMGSKGKKEYTVMGDAVNLAARLEPTNKDYNTLILIGSNTYQAAKDHIVARLVDRIIVTGKTEPIAVYDLIGKKGEVGAEQLEALQRFEQATAEYLKRDWEKALKGFSAVLEISPNDKAAKVFIERIHIFQREPPPPEWQGEHKRAKKD